MKVTDQNLDNVFTYHPASEEQKAKYTELREEAKHFAAAILRLCPDCADRSAALRNVRAAVMWANASIALEKSE